MSIWHGAPCFLRTEENSANTRHMRSIVTALLGVTGLLASSSSARADSLNDLLGPREIAVGEGMRGAATGATAIGLNPAGLPLNRELVFEGGYGWRGTDDATLIGVSACDSTNAAPGCFFYDYLGTNPELGGGMSGNRRTHVGGMALSRLITPRVIVGATIKYFNFKSDMAGEMAKSGFAADFGATLRLTSMINLGLSGQNLYNPEDAAQFPRAAGGGVHANPMPNLALGFDARWLLDADDVGKSIRYGGGAELFLTTSHGQTGWPIRVGGLRDNALETTYVSGGLGMSTMKWSVDVTARRAVKGADETLVIASMRLWGPREAAPSLETMDEN
jgi:hypothetical protein